MQTIQSQVNPRLLKKADRLFTGTLEGRVIELLQNARRAGAKRVEITNAGGEVIVCDDGRGIDDFSTLLDLGGSNWENALEASEDPAGVGVFCLAPRRLTVRSHGKRITIEGEGWYGAPVPVEDDPETLSSNGTLLQFEDEVWTRDLVEPQAVFSRLDVVVDGEHCARESFIAGESVHVSELGCRVKVLRRMQLSQWHRQLLDRGYFFGGILVNFHGQTVQIERNPIGEREYVCLVDLTGEPTGLRLMLPARTRMVENDALKELISRLEIEMYRFIAAEGKHRLSYEKYRRAHELGIALPEATPTFKVGLIFSDDIDPEPCEVTMPKDFPLEKCYRSSDELLRREQVEKVNAHLLAALGELAEPFVPVHIGPLYIGYSWTRVPRIERVSVSVGRTLHEEFVWTSQMKCVDSLTITVESSDGRKHTSAVPMAVDDDYVLVTPEARERVLASQIWFHLGGCWEEGDTFETQQWQAEQEINAFWRNLIGPDEHLRARLFDAVSAIEGAWKHVTVNRDGSARIEFEDGSLQTLVPPTRNSPKENRP